MPEPRDGGLHSLRLHRLTLDDEIEELHRYPEQIGNLESFLSLPTEEFGSIVDYIEYLRNDIKVIVTATSLRILHFEHSTPCEQLCAHASVVFLQALPFTFMFFLFFLALLSVVCGERMVIDLRFDDGVNDNAALRLSTKCQRRRIVFFLAKLAHHMDKDSLHLINICCVSCKSIRTALNEGHVEALQPFARSFCRLVT